MDLFKDITASAVKSEPDVWVSRVVIYERLTPEPLPVRDISLSKGLNIIWAEETEEDDPVAEITGHSAGKTTFCRLLRYLLGEKTFGTKAGMDLIHRAFPQGYVAAELHILGRRWAVRRPFGGGRLSFVLADATVEQLLQERRRSVSQENYARELGLEGLIDRLATGGIVRTSEAIQWGHLLAWCTRDQEARFQSIHEWRSPRSESEAPSFRFPKAGPLFVMRTALGLFLPNELSGEAELANLQRQQEKLTKDLEEKKREPSFRVNLYEQELREQLTKAFPEIDNLAQRPFRSGRIDLEDLNSLTVRAIRQLEDYIQILEKDEQRQQEILEKLGVSIRAQENHQSELQAAYSLEEEAVKQLTGDITQRAERKRKLTELLDRRCPYGEILVGNCDHVKNRQNRFSLTDIHDTRTLGQVAAERKQRQEKHEAELAQLKTVKENLTGQRKDTAKKIESIRLRYHDNRDQIQELRRIYENLKTWTEAIKSSGGHKELDNIRIKLLATDKEIEKIEKELAAFLTKHSKNRKQLATIFSAAVRSVLLSGTYDGKVRFAERELEFRITHGATMTGEAVETLAVLLADVSCLTYNAMAKTAMLPGFLLHDSPREADLGKRLYHSFIRFVAAIQDQFGSQDNCPFQYILTTTTAPPKELQSDQHVALRLNAAKREELLFRKNLGESQIQPSLIGMGG
jgi:hypothetical protein